MIEIHMNATIFIPLDEPNNRENEPSDQQTQRK